VAFHFLGASRTGPKDYGDTLRFLAVLACRGAAATVYITVVRAGASFFALRATKDKLLKQTKARKGWRHEIRQSPKRAREVIRVEIESSFTQPYFNLYDIPL